jgi:two-component system response regulator MprA
MRRSSATSPQHVLRYDDLSVDLASRVAYRGEHYIDLSRREFALLVYLLRNPDRAISRVEFLKNVWANSTNQERSNVVDVYINYVRNKTEQGGLHRLIHTVRGQGYMLHHQRKL